MTTRKCPYCLGGRIERDAPGSTRYACPDCLGTGEIPVCSQCGHDLDDVDAECPRCHSSALYRDFCEDCGPDTPAEGECPECSRLLCHDCIIKHHEQCKDGILPTKP